MEKLSPSQVRVLGLILEGKTGRQIAIELHWAEQTIKNYRVQIYAILGIHRSCELLNIEIRQKAVELITPSTEVRCNPPDSVVNLE